LWDATVSVTEVRDGVEDDSEESYTKCDNLLGRILPYAQMTISRPKARIYMVPASEIALPNLFARVEE
jgi:hypothetical protein